MQKIKLTIVLAMLCLFLNVEGYGAVIVSGIIPKYDTKQSADTNKYKIKPLNVGDKVPDQLWNMPLQVVNHPQGKKTITLNDYKGKLVILDFWATWCGSCIASMPKMNEIQNTFKMASQVLLVTKEDNIKVSRFFDRHSFKLMSVLGDKILNRMFPHLSIPHYAIINSDGIIAAITSSDQITNDNISKLIEGLMPQIRIKSDKDTKAPLFSLSGLPFDKLRHYSIFFEGKLDGYPGGTVQRQYADLLGVSFSNVTLITLFKTVIRNLYPELNHKRIILKVQDSSKLFYTATALSKKEWYEKNLYSYEILLPKSESKEIYNYMLTDINHLSNFKAEIGIKKMTVLQLVIKDKERFKNRSQQGKEDGVTKQFNDVSTSSLVNYLDGSVQIPFIVIDGTDYIGKINVSLSSNFRNLNEVKTQLNQQGFDLMETEKEVKIFLISQRTSLGQVNQLD
jgi:thiol-disulfide isomerase/thioredoxin